MNPIGAFFSKFAWQCGAAVSGVLLIIVAGFLVAAQVENSRITKASNALDDKINNPVTGYVIKLAQAETNTVTVKTALESQVAALKKKADADRAALRATEVRLAAAQADSRVARRQAADLLARTPQGVTLEERVRDVDAQVLEMLK